MFTTFAYHPGYVNKYYLKKNESSLFTTAGFIFVTNTYDEGTYTLSSSTVFPAVVQPEPFFRPTLDVLFKHTCIT